MTQEGLGKWWCGGSWGQSQGLTAQQVAQIVVGYQGPHYVWTEGMSDWLQAEHVPEIAGAIRELGGPTVDEPLLHQPRPPAPGLLGSAPPRLVLALGGVLIFLIFLVLLVVVVSGGESTPAPQQTAELPAPPVEQPAAPVLAQPAPKPPPVPRLPRVRALPDRPTAWSRVPIKDRSRRHGYGDGSTELLEANGTLHSAGRVGDVKADTAWCESAPGDGVGEWVELWLDCGSWTDAGVAGLGLRAGFSSKRSLWVQNNRVAEALVTIDVGARVLWEAEVVLADDASQQFIEFPSTFRCPRGEAMRAHLEIRAVHQGRDFTDTCVSTMAFYRPER